LPNHTTIICLIGENSIVSWSTFGLTSTQVYRKLRDAGYKRTYDSMCRQIRQMRLNITKKRKSYPKSKYHKNPATYPGERVQIDVKYVPNECIGFEVITADITK